MRRLVRPSVLCLLAIQMSSAAVSGFVFVLEEDDTLGATAHGSYRAMYADALRAAARGGARAVALKFFFVEPDPIGDVPLAAAMEEVPTWLQFALRGDPAIENPVPAALRTGAPASEPGWMSDELPDMPVAELAEAAVGFGFVDARTDFDVDRMPLFGVLDGRVVPALTTVLLEVRFPELEVTSSELRRAGSRMPVARDGTAVCEVEELADSSFVPLVDLLEGRVDGERLDGAVVVIGYDGVDAPRFSTGFLSSRSAHLLFMDRLICVEGLLGE